MRQHNITDLCSFLVWSRGVTSSLDYYVYLLNIKSYQVRAEHIDNIQNIGRRFNEHNDKITLSTIRIHIIPTIKIIS